VKTIYWNELGASVEVVGTINAGVPFVLIVEGATASALSATFGRARLVITPEQVKLIIAGLIILAVVGLVLFAFARGYKISGKARRPDGTEYEIRFEPKPRPKRALQRTHRKRRHAEPKR
jgi:hypothetical protein